MIQEKRKYARISTVLNFTYKIKNSAEKEAGAITKDISPGGIGAVLDNRIKKGDLLELKISLAGLVKPVQAFAAVAWIKEETRGKLSVGLEFKEIASDDKSRLFEYICLLMVQELEKFK